MSCRLQGLFEQTSVPYKHCNYLNGGWLWIQDDPPPPQTKEHISIWNVIWYLHINLIQLLWANMWKILNILSHVGGYAWRKWWVLVRMIGSIGTLVTVCLNYNQFIMLLLYTLSVHRCTCTSIRSFHYLQSLYCMVLTCTHWFPKSVSTGFHYPFPGNGFITLSLDKSSSHTLSLCRPTSTTNFSWPSLTASCLTVMLGTLLYSHGTGTHHKKHSLYCYITWGTTWLLLLC
jgi:hypothetical protein